MDQKSEKTPLELRTERKRRRREKKLAKKEKIRNLPKWRRVLRVIRKTIAALIIMSFLVSGIGAAVVWHRYGDIVTKSVTEGFKIASQIREEDFIQRQPTVVYDVHGNVLKEFKQFEYDAPKYEEINPYFLKGIVAVEDHRFYIHHGVDLYGTLRSVFKTVLGGSVQGGSTITQQLVRNVILQDSNVTIERKLKEQVVAQELEKRFSKKEILQHYLNNVYFGHGNYGIGPASRYYFGKDQNELTVDEVAVIIGITNNPTLFDPINQPESALRKRNTILTTFLTNGIISQQEYDELIQKPLQLNVQEHHIDNHVNESYALSFAVHKATEALMEANGFVFQYRFDTRDEYNAYHERYDEEYDKTRQRILNGGYEIHTSIDPSVQERLETLAKQELTGYSDKIQMAIATVDNRTGEVVALVGGRDVKNDYFNRAYQGVRQPGSTAKPITVYAKAFELGYTPQSQLVDRPIKNGPKNWYDGYWGTMSIRYAIEQSVNTVAYQLANEVGSDAMLEQLEKMKFSHLAPEDNTTIIALGGFTYGTTMVEMASAYSSLIRNGKFIEPTNIREIKDIVTGETIVKNDCEEIPVFREDAAYITLDTLKGVMKTGTGKLAQPSNYPYVIGKTGTTDKNHDSLFVGGTPYYTTAVWVGYDTPSPLNNSEKNLPKYLFREWNEKLHQGLDVMDFPMPDSVYRYGNAIYSRMKTYEDLEKERKAKEDRRMEKEMQYQRERLALEDYRILYGLTSEEEQKREAKVEEALREAESFVMTEVEDYEIWMGLIEEAKDLNKEVKHQAARNRFHQRINELEIIAATEKQNILKRIEEEKQRQKELEEQRKKEEQEIQQMLNEFQGWMKRIENGEAFTEEEVSILETLVQRLKEKGIEVPELKITYVETGEDEQPEEQSGQSPEKQPDDSPE